MQTYSVTDFVAGKSDKYNDRPLIGQVTSINKHDITIDWFVGTYSGVWKTWRGQEGGKTVTYTAMTDILQTVPFTKVWRLPTATIATLKNLY